jgi:hypothetical protein
MTGNRAAETAGCAADDDGFRHDDGKWLGVVGKGWVVGMVVWRWGDVVGGFRIGELV